MVFCRNILVVLSVILFSNVTLAVTFGTRVQDQVQRLATAPSTQSNAYPVAPLRLIAKGSELSAFRARLTKQGIAFTDYQSFVRIDQMPTELATLSGTEDIFVDIGRKLYPLLDQSVTAIGVNGNVRNQRDGRDVIIAVLDTGIDFTHPDFRNKDGSTRFIAYWDQNAKPRKEGEFGLVCDAVAINRVLLQDQISACPNDSEEAIAGFLPGGHGSHVAGIAAGGDSKYRGVAPGAMLLGVRMTFDEAGLVDAIAWSHQVAQQLGKPLVINLSLGANDAGHDGYAPSEQMVDRISGSGVIVVAAAGNEHSVPIHVSSTTDSEENRARFEVLGLFDPEQFHLEAWSNDGDGFEVALALENRGKPLQIADQTDFFRYGAFEPLASTTLQDNGKSIAEVVALPQTTPEGAGIRLQLNALDGSLRSYTWHLIWRSPKGEFDAWLTDRVASFEDLSGNKTLTFVDGSTRTAVFIPGDTRKTLTLPGTARDVITVTGFVSRKQWPTISGEIAQSTSDPELGELLDIASIGPTRDGRMKPDIAAPGEFIISSYATTLGENIGSDLRRADELHWVQRGTSMAAPHVAGMVALLLQENDQLTSADIIDTLAQLAIIDADTGDVPNARWGHGKATLAGIDTTTAWQTQTRNDSSAPTISNAELTREGNRITVIWKTDELASAELMFEGKTLTVGSFAVDHEIEYKGALPDSVMIYSIDPRGNRSDPLRLKVPRTGCGLSGATRQSSVMMLLFMLVGYLYFRHTGGYWLSHQYRSRGAN